MSTGVAACKGLMVAATRQHTGKTSVSMALVSGLRRIFGPTRVAFMKPVGQRFTMVDGEKVGGVSHAAAVWTSCSAA